MHMRCHQASVILVFFHSWISTCWEKNWYPRPQFLFFPSISIHTHPLQLLLLSSYCNHLACSCPPIPLALFNLSSACPHPAFYLFSHTPVPPPLPLLLQRPSPTFSSTYITPPSPLSSSCPSLLALLPNSWGPSWDSCTQPPHLHMQSYQLSFRLQQQELWEDKGKISPGTAHCCNGKRLNAESNQLRPQSLRIKCIQLSGHQKYPKGQGVLRGDRIFRALEQYVQMYLCL